MKKIIALLLAAIMVLGLAACASKTEPAADTTTAEPAAEPAETTEETPAAEEETPAAEEEAPAADDVKHVVYIVNGNLGGKPSTPTDGNSRSWNRRQANFSGENILAMTL